jgi:hypothetical protein
MEGKIRQKETKACPPASVSQIHVRSDVRSGADLETCQFNLNKWRDRYYYWYNVAHKQGKV